MSATLLPCPFCGSSNIMPDRPKVTHTSCGGCGVEAYTCAAAGESWNHRSVGALIGSLPALAADEMERLADALVEARAKAAAVEWINGLDGVRFKVEQ